MAGGCLGVKVHPGFVGFFLSFSLVCVGLGSFCFWFWQGLFVVFGSLLSFPLCEVSF